MVFPSSSILYTLLLLVLSFNSNIFYYRCICHAFQYSRKRKFRDGCVDVEFPPKFNHSNSGDFFFNFSSCHHVWNFKLLRNSCSWISLLLLTSSLYCTSPSLATSPLISIHLYDFYNIFNSDGNHWANLHYCHICESPLEYHRCRLQIITWLHCLLRVHLCSSSSPSFFSPDHSSFL